MARFLKLPKRKTQAEMLTQGTQISPTRPQTAWNFRQLISLHQARRQITEMGRLPALSACTQR